MLTRLLWLALLACSCLNAAPLPTPATLDRLARDPNWVALGHYEYKRLRGWHSYVDDRRFFLAADGRYQPAHELAATLQALYAPASLGDRHAQCVFPARTRWLRTALQLTDLPVVNCPEFQRWYGDIAPHSAVLVFPAAYLNSPSSMFGHTLLRIDQAQTQADQTALLSYAINFGAYVEGSDNSMLYAWKGLAGGYPGLFSLVPYQQKLAEYRSLENRDLWEYQLNLSPEETGRLVEHVWELQQIRFDYYFFDENCSYRLLELLQVARPSLQLTGQFPLAAIPTDTVKAVKAAGLVQHIDYRPSRERELATRAAPLSTAEQALARQIANAPAGAASPELNALPRERQALVLDTAYRLDRYNATGLARDSARSQRSFGLLQAINRNPPPALRVERPGLPEEGHPSRTWELGLGSRDDRAFAEYGLRMAYHDLNDNAYGFPLGAQIELGGLKVRQYEGGDWQVQQLNLATIRSLSPRSALLKPWSWQVAGGLERVPGKHGDAVLVTHLNGGAGGTWEAAPGVLAFALGTARVEHNTEFSAFAAGALGFDSGLLWRNRLGNLRLEATGDWFNNGEARRQLSLSQQWELAPDLGVRLSAQRDFSHLGGTTNELMLELKWYHY